MLLIIHILIAISSLALTSWMVIRPSSTKISAAYALAGLTLLSGTLLAISSPGYLVQACVSGLIYNALAFGGIKLAGRKLATQA